MIVTVENYQRHKKSTIEVGPGVTSLIGKSDHGKTSIVRAIKWFRFDRPLGNNFVRKGGKRVVRVSIDSVSHIKDKLGNYYLLDGEKVETKRAQELCGIDTVNIQEQLDAPFLIKATAGEVARQLALLIDLEKPQVLLKEIKNKGTKLNTDRTALISLKSNLEENLEQYIPLLRYKRALLEIESTLASIKKQHEALVTLAATVENATVALTRLDTIPDTTGAIATATSLLQNARRLTQQHLNVSSFSTILDTAIEKENGRITDYSTMHNTGELLLGQIKNRVEEVEFNANLWDTLLYLRGLRVIITKGEKANGIVDNVQGKIESIKNMGKVILTIEEAKLKSEELRMSMLAEANADRHLEETRKSLGVQDACPFCGRL